MRNRNWIRRILAAVGLIAATLVAIDATPACNASTYAATGHVQWGTADPTVGRQVIVRVALVSGGATTTTVVTNASGDFSHTWIGAYGNVHYVTVTVEGATNSVTGGASRQINWFGGGTRNFGVWTVPGGPGGEPEDVDRDGIDDAEEDRLLQKLAPVVWLHPADWNKPASVDWVLPRSHMNYNHLGQFLFFGCDDHSVIEHGDPEYGTGSIDDITNQLHQSSSSFPSCNDTGGFHRSDSYSPSGREGFFLQQYNPSHSGASTTSDWVTYGHVFPHSANRVVVQYWFFYPYNDGYAFGNHESDWEHIVLIVEPLNGDAITEIWYSQHDDPRKYDLSEVTMSGTHPVVYAAKGSHANYAAFETLEILGVFIDRCIDSFSVLGQKVDYCTNTGVRWDTWDTSTFGGVVNIGESKFTIDADWLRYSGRWGEIGQDHLGLPEDATSGKKGPAYQYRYWRYCGSPEICGNGLDDDVDGVVDEAACSNLPDLTVDRLNPVLYAGGIPGPAVVAPGDKLFLEGWIANEGGVASTAFGVRLAMSTDPIYDPTDEELSMLAYPSLGQNTFESLDEQTAISVPMLVDGSYYVVAKVDSGDSVIEGFAAESNNTDASEFAVEVISDALLLENFNAGTANDFTPISGTWDASGGTYMATGTGIDDNSTVSLFSSPEPSVTMEFDVWVSDEGQGSSYHPYFGAILRYEDPSHLLRFDTYRTTQTNVRLISWDGGFTYIGTAVLPYDLDTGVHHVKLADSGRDITIWIDGEQVLTGSYTGPVSQGNRGLFVDFSTSVAFDNVVVHEWLDVDEDGYTVDQGDCNDLNPAVNPGHAEVCSTSFDDDCDGYVNEGCGGGSPIFRKPPIVVQEDPGNP